MQDKSYKLFNAVDRIHGYDVNLVNLITLFVTLGHTLLNKIKLQYLDQNERLINYVTIDNINLSVFKKAYNVYTGSIIKEPSEASDAIYDPYFDYLITYDPDTLFDIYHYILDSILEGAIKATYMADKDGAIGHISYIIPLSTQILQGIEKIKKEIDNCSIDSLAVLDKYLEKIGSFVPTLW